MAVNLTPAAWSSRAEDKSLRMPEWMRREPVREAGLPFGPRHLCEDPERNFAWMSLPRSMEQAPGRSVSPGPGLAIPPGGMLSSQLRPHNPALNTLWGCPSSSAAAAASTTKGMPTGGVAPTLSASFLPGPPSPVHTAAFAPGAQFSWTPASLSASRLPLPDDLQSPLDALEGKIKQDAARDNELERQVWQLKLELGQAQEHVEQCNLEWRDRVNVMEVDEERACRRATEALRAQTSEAAVAREATQRAADADQRTFAEAAAEKMRLQEEVKQVWAELIEERAAKSEAQRACNEAKRSLRSSQVRNEELLTEVDRHQADCQRMRQEKSMQDVQNADLKRSYEEKLVGAASKSQHDEDRIRTLETNVQQREAEVKFCKHDVQSLEAQSKSYEDRLMTQENTIRQMGDALRACEEKCQATIREYEVTAQRMSEDLRNAAEQKKCLEAQVNSQKETIGGLEASARQQDITSREALRSCEDTLRNARADLNAKERWAGQLEDEIRRLGDEARSFKESERRQNVQSEDLQSKCQALREENAELEAKVSTLESNNALSQDHLAENQALWEEKVRTLETEIRLERDKIMQLESQNEVQCLREDELQEKVQENESKYQQQLEATKIAEDEAKACKVELESIKARPRIHGDPVDRQIELEGKVRALERQRNASDISERNARERTAGPAIGSEGPAIGSEGPAIGSERQRNASEMPGSGYRNLFQRYSKSSLEVDVSEDALREPSTNSTHRYR